MFSLIRQVHAIRPLLVITKRFPWLFGGLQDQMSTLSTISYDTIWGVAIKKHKIHILTFLYFNEIDNVLLLWYQDTLFWICYFNIVKYESHICHLGQLKNLFWCLLNYFLVLVNEPKNLKNKAWSCARWYLDKVVEKCCWGIHLKRKPLTAIYQFIWWWYYLDQN